MAIAEAQCLEQGRRLIVGVNEFLEESEAAVEILKVGEDAEHTQRRRLTELKARRDPALRNQG